MPFPADGLRGVVPPICTPFTDDGEVDATSLIALTDRLLTAGVDGVFVLGSTGEGSQLTDDQRDLVVRTVAGHVGGRVPVLAGALDPSTVRAAATAQRFRDIGADALVATAPTYFPAEGDELDRHFRTLAEVGLPVLAYDIPVRVHQKLPLDLLVALARGGVLAGVKDSSNDDMAMRALVRATADVEGFTVLTGSETMVDVQLGFGVHGNVPGMGNVDPDGFVRLYRAVTAGDTTAADAEQARLAALTRMYQVGDTPRSGSGIVAFKASLHALGVIASPAMAPPAVPFAGAEVDRVREVLVEGGLL